MASLVAGELPKGKILGSFAEISNFIRSAPHFARQAASELEIGCAHLKECCTQLGYLKTYVEAAYDEAGLSDNVEECETIKSAAIVVDQITNTLFPGCMALLEGIAAAHADAEILSEMDILSDETPKEKPKEVQP